MKRILLIRHGQTDWNAEGRWQGQLQVPLNDAGLEQARLLGAYLQNHPITAVYSSDLSRAHATAASIADPLHLIVRTDTRWRELHLGILQGKTTNEINTQHGDVALKMREDYLDYVVPQGESRRAMQVRAYEAYREIVATEPGPEIVIVSHGGTIRVVLMKLFGDDIVQKSVRNTSISIIETDGEKHRLLETAITPHLVSDAERTPPKTGSNYRHEVL